MIEFVFIRHARSVQNKSVGPSFWVISEEGIPEIDQLTKANSIQKISLFYCSAEQKAQQTAEYLREKIQHKSNIPLYVDKRLNEVNRDLGPFYNTEEKFRQTVRRSFEYKEQSIDSWEPAERATMRMTTFIDEMKKKYAHTDITLGVVSHGSIISLYFGKIGDYYDDTEKLFQKWSCIPFCAWGVIINDKIIHPFE